MTVALREIRLYGPLASEFGRVFRLAVQSPAEAIRALCAVLPGFEKAFLGADGRAEYFVFVGRGASRKTIETRQKDDLVDRSAPIRFVPAVAGAKRQGLGQTILGAVLVVVGIVINVVSEGAGAPIGNAFIQAGVAMMVGGVVRMLSPQRKTEDSKGQNDPSYGMDAGAVNNADAGLPVPLAYGRMIVGSVQVSAGLSTDELGSGYMSDGVGPPSPLPLPDYMDPYPVDSGDVYVDTNRGNRGS